MSDFELKLAGLRKIEDLETSIRSGDAIINEMRGKVEDLHDQQSQLKDSLKKDAVNFYHNAHLSMQKKMKEELSKENEKAIAAMSARLEKMEAQCQAKDQMISKLEAENKDKDEKIQELEAANRAKDKTFDLVFAILESHSARLGCAKQE